VKTSNYAGFINTGQCSSNVYALLLLVCIVQVALHLPMALQLMDSNLPIWVLDHTVSRLGLVVLVVVVDSGVARQLVAYLATCLGRRQPVSSIISRIPILLVVGAHGGLDRHQDGVAAKEHSVVEAEAPAQAQGLPPVVHINVV